MIFIQKRSFRGGLLALSLAAITASPFGQNNCIASQVLLAESPAYKPGRGPIVVVDEAHYNFHTISSRYQRFADVLRQDGYTVRSGQSQFSSATLKGTKVLVIASALSERNRDASNWSPPTWSAFTDEEIRSVRKWVRNGGSLLLITDHLPFAGAAVKLAAAFGFELINGYALDRREIQQATLDRPYVFVRSHDTPRDGTLGSHAITRGSNASARVEHVMTFMGAAIRATEPAIPLLVFGKEIRSYQTTTFGKISAGTPSIPANGLLQGAAQSYGKGRVVVFAEAGLFTVQWQRGQPLGLGSPDNGGNRQLLLNTMHWLDGSLK
jgi:hypothetical protein